jgi:hypothetical protein
MLIGRRVSNANIVRNWVTHSRPAKNWKKERRKAPHNTASNGASNSKN